jgi:uncharacterized protein YgiM (DUF1202 family)
MERGRRQREHDKRSEDSNKETYTDTYKDTYKDTLKESHQQHPPTHAPAYTHAHPAQQSPGDTYKDTYQDTYKNIPLTSLPTVETAKLIAAAEEDYMLYSKVQILKSNLYSDLFSKYTRSLTFENPPPPPP